jgi:hypothetical protein
LPFQPDWYLRHPHLPLPFNEGCQQREGKYHRQHREQMTGGKRPKRRNESARAFSHPIRLPVGAQLNALRNTNEKRVRSWLAPRV